MRYFIALIVLLVVFLVTLAVFKRKQRHRKPTIEELIGQAEAAGRSLAAYADKTYEPLGSTTDEIFSHENDDMKESVLGALCYRIGQKAASRGESNLTETERRLSAVYWFEGQVMNGGFHQYFFNSTGNVAEVALAGLNEMGATTAAALLERAMAEFPDGKPPTDRQERWKVMNETESRSKPFWDKCDSEYYDRKENTFELCLAYAKKKRAEIILS